MGNGFFCGGTPLDFYEREMRKPPGYFRKGQGLLITEQLDWKDRGSYEEVVDIVITRMQMEHLKKRIDQIFSEHSKGWMYLDDRHRSAYNRLMNGKRKAGICHRANYAASIFLLSVDENLWNIVKSNVLDTGIYFDRIRLGSVTLEQYILFHAAKDVYHDSKHVRLSELADRKLIPDDIRLPDDIYQSICKIGSIEDLTAVNELCSRMVRMGDEGMERLSMVARFAKAEHPSQMAELSRHLHEFEIVKGVHDLKEYGDFVINKSNTFEVDELIQPYIDYEQFAKDKIATMYVQGCGYTKKEPAKQIFLHLRTDRHRIMRRLWMGIPQSNLVQKRKEKGRLAMHQPTGEWNKTL